MNIDDLKELDKPGFISVEAIVLEERAKVKSLAHPFRFLCNDGQRYWVKWHSQYNRLADELIAGRLAELSGAGPLAQVIWVPPSMFNLDDADQKYEGIVLGSSHIPETVNSKEIQPLLNVGSFDPKTIDGFSRARVIAFQTWLKIGDAQVLINPTNGLTYSFDHGDAFGTLDDSRPVPTVAKIPGVSNQIGKDSDMINSAVDKIEDIPEDNLLKAVANVPERGYWKGPIDWRFKVFEWILKRRTLLREVLEEWLNQ